MNLSIIIPTYNEKENIKILIPKIEENLKKNNINGEIIIVDDNSPDKTSKEVEKLNKKYKNITLILRKNRKGIASAWFEGFDAAKGDYIACMDADLCHEPEDLIRMYNTLNKYDLVIGSRYMKGGSGMKDKSFFAIIASNFGQHFIQFILGLKTKDNTHSFRIFKKEVFHTIKNNLNVSGNIFLVDFLYKARKKNYNISEIPIKYGKRIYGETKLNIFNESLKMIFKVIKLRLEFFKIK